MTPSKSNRDDFAGWGLPEENWSKLPHQFIEMLPRFQSRSEQTVILYILRHTWGYQEFGDDDFKAITLEEFENGRKRKDGSRIDGGTGLSRNSIKTGLKQAKEDGLIEVRTDNRDKARIEKSYRLTARGSKIDPPVSKSDPLPSKIDPRTEKDTIETNNSKIAPAKKRQRKPDLLFETVCKFSFGKLYTDIGHSRGQANKIAKFMRAAGVTPEQLEAGYKFYAKNNKDGIRMTSPDTILDKVQKALDAANGARIPTRDELEAMPDWTPFHTAYARVYSVAPDALADVAQMSADDAKANLRSRWNNTTHAALMREILTDDELAEIEA